MKKENNTIQNVKDFARHEKGMGLVIVILVMVFLSTIGLALITTTSTGPAVAANVRTQQEAFNAAEAGFDASWVNIQGFFSGGGWVNFDGHYLQDPTGIELPGDSNYFRSQTDEELLNLIGDFNAGTTAYTNVIFYKQTYIPAKGGGLDPKYTYTAFLIDDEWGGGTSDHNDVILVCIGVVQKGGSLTTTRLEIELAIDVGSSP